MNEGLRDLLLFGGVFVLWGLVDIFVAWLLRNEQRGPTYTREPPNTAPPTRYLQMADDE